MAARIAVIVCFVALLVAPFALRPAAAPTAAAAAATTRTLIIITPHNEQIRTEFGRAFSEWHLKNFGEPVDVIFNVPGGTSEIRKMLEAQYTAAFEAGEPPGGQADLVFGGGSYEHGALERGVRVRVDGDEGGERSEPITAPVRFPQAWLDEVYGENAIGNGRLYDPDGYWFGTALSSFGIIYNRDALAFAGAPEPVTWSDLCRPSLRGWVALVNPGQSGSITTAFESILQCLGWDEGWRILRRAGANARYFSGTSLRPPTDVSQGDAAEGVCIDFYGRYQAQALAVAGEAGRVGYVDPAGVTTIDADPISMLRGALHPEIAERFIRFCLSEEGQALWQFRAGDPAGDGLGPQRFELRRLMIRRSMYTDYFDRAIDRVNPYEIARKVENPDRNVRAFVPVLFAAMAMDDHHELQAAWRAVTEHPAFPADDPLVRPADVTDPVLRRMLELLDAMPEIEAPDGTVYSLARPEDLGPLRDGWIDGGWAKKHMWPPNADRNDDLRRRLAKFFREKYEEVVRVGEGRQ